jgi:ABC-type glutathione transport system ATPase component
MEEVAASPLPFGRGWTVIPAVMSTLLSANELRLSCGYRTLLDGVTLAVSAGEKVGLVGRNGCGKVRVAVTLPASGTRGFPRIVTRSVADGLP